MACEGGGEGVGITCGDDSSSSGGGKGSSGQKHVAAKLGQHTVKDRACRTSVRHLCLPACLHINRSAGASSHACGQRSAHFMWWTLHNKACTTKDAR